LTAVRWSVDNLLDGLSGPLEPRQRDDLAAVKASLVPLERMVNDLLAVARLELGASPPASEPVSLAAAVEEAALAVRPHAASKGVEVVRSVPDGLPSVRGRRDALFQVVLNLVDNAVKYAPPGSAVDVAAASGPDGTVLLSVRDRGPGIGDSDPDGLFRLFGQGESSPHSASKGFGVGLHVVRSFVEAMGGAVSAANHPDGGAVFSCRLREWAAGGREA
jgi:protein-histidine pros-kinase